MGVKLYIKDSLNGMIHEYGTNPHDSLVLNDDGSIHYHNLQNGAGTFDAEEGYTFCLPDGSDPRTDKNVIAYGANPYLDIGGDRI